MMMRNLLLLEDDDELLFGMQSYFSDGAFKVICSQTLDEAKIAFSRQPMALAIVDLHLNDLQRADGLEFVRYVRQHCDKTPIIILTAYGSNEMETQAKSLGASCVLNKPISLSILENYVSSFL